MKAQNTFRFAAIFAAIFSWLAASQAGPVTIQTVYVGDPGNLGDSAYNSGLGTSTVPDTGPGSVSYGYNLGTYDVTNAQYVAFLNAVDPTGANLLQLYNSNMATHPQANIFWNGSSYVVNAGYAEKPVIYVNWYNAARFTNWLTNGEGNGGTETGVYTLTGLTSVAALPADHSALVGAGTKWFLPTESERYKAAYYKGGNTNAGYWKYPFQSNTQPMQNTVPGGIDSGNFFNGVYAATQSYGLDFALNFLTDVGAYASAKSPYGSYDMGGNVFQWTETLIGSTREGRGSSWNFDGGHLGTFSHIHDSPLDTSDELGFRVAMLPEPSSIALFALGASSVVIIAWRNRRPAAPSSAHLLQ